MNQILWIINQSDKVDFMMTAKMPQNVVRADLIAFVRGKRDPMSQEENLQEHRVR
jgi:hypothetical protein